MWLYWIILALVLNLITFGVVPIICIVLVCLGLLIVAYHYGKLASHDLINDFQQRYKMPSRGIHRVKESMENTVKVRNFDKRMTGVAAIDSILIEVLEYALRDYIKNWYNNISEHDQFLDDVWLCIQGVIINFANRTKEIDWLPYFTNQLVDDFASHIRLYRRAYDRLLIKKDKEDITMDNAFFDLEVEMEKTICHDLVCNDTFEEKRYLQVLSEVLLFLLLPPEDFHNKIFRYTLREVLVNGILQPLIDLFSDPDYINQNVVWLCKDSLMTNEIFINVVNCTNEKEEIEAVKEKVHRDIYKWRSQDTGGDDDVMIKQNLNSLLYVEEICQRRLSRLQGDVTDGEFENIISSNQNIFIMSFDDIISNNLAVQAFLEFLTSVGQQQYLFFYLNVEGYRILAEQQLGIVEDGGSGSSYRKEPDMDALRQAASLLYDQYLSDKAVNRVRINDDALKRVTYTIRRKLFTESLFDEVQAEVYVLLHNEKYYDAFINSVHYTKLLSDMSLLDDGKLAFDEEDLINSCDNNVPNESAEDMYDVIEMDSVPLDFTLTAQVSQSGLAKDNNKSFGVFTISVKKRSENVVIRSWDVFRRYSDFFDLHMVIFERYGSISGLILPGKTAFRNITTGFLEKRRKALDAYLQALLSNDVLHSHKGLFDIIVKFLSPEMWEKHKSDLSLKVDTFMNPIKSSVRQVSSAVRTVPDSMSDSLVGLGNIFKLRSNSLNLHQSEKVGAKLDIEKDDNIPLRIMMLLMDEVFDLRNKNQWFRRRIVAILRQIIRATYGDKINRKIVEQVDAYTSAEQISEYVKKFRDAFWPSGVLAEERPPRDQNTVMRTRVACKAKMLSCISDQLRHLMGNETVSRGVFRVFEMLQIKTLNKRLVFVLVEGVLQTMFPDNKFPDILQKLHSQSPRVKSFTTNRKP